MSIFERTFPHAAKLLQTIPSIALLLIATAAGADEVLLPKNAAQADIQKTMDATKPGDIVILPAGTTVLASPLNLKSGVTLSGPADGLAVLDASAVHEPVIIFCDRLDDITLRRIEFRNVGLHFHGTLSHDAGKNIRVEGCRFTDLRRLKNEPSLFILATYSTNVTVRDCVFLRTAAHHGNGVTFWRAHDCTLERCKFGEDGKRFPATEHGHFMNAVYGNGWGKDEEGDSVRCVNLRLIGNLLRRSPSASSEEDHGIYILGARGLVMEDNDIAGWTPELTGGAIKARDGEAYVVRGNLCADSGILLYNYANCAYPFVNVLVAGNTIRLPRWDDQIAGKASGISYWRNDPASTEKAVRIEDNVIENGIIVVHPPVNSKEFNAEGGGVRRNKADAVILAEGIDAEKNEEKRPGWTFPPSPASR